jgi:hypothetical protein
MNEETPVAPGVGKGSSGRGPAAITFRCRPTPACNSVNEILLYGDLLSDVRFLRQRGFAVHMEGHLYRVDNRLMDVEELLAVVARARRLNGGK